MFENVDERTDDGVTGILIAHLGAFCSGELTKTKRHKLYSHFPFIHYMIFSALVHIRMKTVII